MNFQPVSTCVMPGSDRPFPIISAEIKMRVPDNNLIGKLIGKNGCVLQKIMDETFSVISINDKTDNSNVDRIITIKASTLEDIVAAEKRVSQKLRQDLENDINAGINYNYIAYNMNNYNKVSNVVSGMDNMVPQYLACQTPSNISGAFNPFGRSVPAYANCHGPVSVPMAVGGSTLFYQPNIIPAYAVNTVNPLFTYSNQPATPILKSRIYVPEHMVGSLIGTKGQNIKNMMQVTGAIIQIDAENRKVKNGKEQDDLPNSIDKSMNADVFESPHSLEATELNGNLVEKDKSQEQIEPSIDSEHSNSFFGKQTETTTNSELSDGNGHPSTSSKSSSQNKSKRVGQNEATETPYLRAVFISGYDYQVYEAQRMIFQKISEFMRYLFTNNSFYIVVLGRYFDDCILTCEAIVPTKCIGRIIGRGGSNVRELQRASNSTIKIPDAASYQGTNFYYVYVIKGTESPVKITGNFFAFQMVQARVGAMVAETEIKESRDYEGKRSARNSSTNRGSIYKQNGKNETLSSTNSTPIGTAIQAASTPNA